MGRPEDRRLPPALARAFRNDVIERIAHKDVKRGKLLRALRIPPKWTESSILRALGEVRSESWISRALKAGADLSWRTAVELAIRVESCRVKLANSILDQIASFELDESTAIVLIHTGDSKRLARHLAMRAVRMSVTSPATQRCLERMLLNELQPFERFNETPTGKRIWATMHVKSDDARVQFFRDIHYLRVKGDEWETPGPIGVLIRLAQRR